MTNAKWTIILENNMICTILLQYLMKRGVCWCGAEMLLLIRFSSHILLVFLPSCFRVVVRCFWILDLVLQWWCSKLVSAMLCIFSLFSLFDYWCVCLGVSLLVYLCALDIYACFIWMLCFYVFVCLFVCILLHLVVWYHCVGNWQKQNCFGFLTVFW
jgi:hypothetical protein